MNITSFLIYCFIVTFTPGPTNIVILSTVHNSGTKKAMEYTYGATIAFGLLLVISAMLNTMLITVIPKILIVMQIIGSCLYALSRLSNLQNGYIQTSCKPNCYLYVRLPYAVFKSKGSTIYNDCNSKLYFALLYRNVCGDNKCYSNNNYWIFSIYYMGSFRNNLQEVFTES